VAQAADPLDLDLDLVAGCDRADALRRPRGDDVARFEREVGRDLLDQLWDREDHLLAAGVLADLAVLSQDHVGVGGDVFRRRDGRADRRGIVEGFATDPVLFLALVLPVGEVDETGQARHDVHRVGGVDVTALFTDDRREFGLVVDLVLAGEQWNLVTVAGDGTGRFQEQHRPVRDVRVELGGVIGVVAPDTDDLARLAGREHVDVLWIVRPSGEADLPAGTTGVGVCRRSVVVDPLAGPDAPGRIAESDSFHASLFVDSGIMGCGVGQYRSHVVDRGRIPEHDEAVGGNGENCGFIFVAAVRTRRMAELDAETLLPSPRTREQAAAGEVTQIHRGQQYAEEGDTFAIDGSRFEVVAVSDRTLGDLTDEDARAEGARDLEHYRQILDRAHDQFEWDPDSEVVRHQFESQ
jgi:hypothetical protein